MSTRGFLGFVADGQCKVAYNHSDSYPDWLGFQMLHWLRSADLSDAQAKAIELRVVAPDSEPTDEDVRSLKRFHNPHVGGHSERPTWYQLLRETQGEPAAMLEAGVIEDASNFPYDSLFAEWGYLADFDAQRFEVYQGFQHERHEAGRFARPEPNDGYYPCALIAAWPFTDLPDDERFLAALAEDDA